VAGIGLLSAVSLKALVAIYLLAGLYLLGWHWRNKKHITFRLFARSYLRFWTVWLVLLFLPAAMLRLTSPAIARYLAFVYAAYGLGLLWFACAVVTLGYTEPLREAARRRGLNPRNYVGRKSQERAVLYPIVYPYFWIPFFLATAAAAVGASLYHWELL